MIKMSEEQKDSLFDAVKAIVEELNPANVEVLKDLLSAAIERRIESKEKSALATIDSRMKLLDKQFKEETTTLKKEISDALKVVEEIKKSSMEAIEAAKKGALEEALKEISKVVDLIGGPEELKKILEAIPDFKDPLSKLWGLMSSKKFTTKQLLAGLTAIGTIISLIWTLLTQFGIV